MTTFKTIAAAIAFSAALAAPSLSAQVTAQSAVTVSYADLNLGSEEGRRVLDARIDRAVEKVCGRTTGKIAMDQAIKRCQRETLSAASPARDLAVADYGKSRFAKSEAKVIRLIAQ